MKPARSLLTLVAGCSLLFSILLSTPKGHSVSISGDHFIRDDKPYQIISGAMHYPRVPREYWRDRMKKARAMGLNTIETYVFWNLHEPSPGKFVFSGNLDVAEYVRLAQEEGLNVILRPGPYICSEWDFGGLPSWLLADPEMVVRTKDPKFLAAADRYLTRLGQELAPLLASRGGPIIMVQIENEYGSFGADTEYMDHIRQSLIHAGFGESLLYTADGTDRLEQGTLPGVLAVANFGPGQAKNAFAALEKFEPGKPLMTGEYWDGWFDSWGGRHAQTDGAAQAAELEWMLQQGYSVNLYMFHGGTTFGFMNGANFQPRPHDAYQPQVTSYDYDAPLDEAGRPTKKYFLFRDAIARIKGVSPPALPNSEPTIAIPKFTLSESTSLRSNLPRAIGTDAPKPMEDYGQAYGYILYRTQIAGPAKGELIVNGLHDFGNVYVNQMHAGQLDRRLKQDRLSISVPEGSSTLDILVENLGRINYGPYLQDDRKGITGTVTFNAQELKGWKVYSLPMTDTQKLSSWGANTTRGPAFQRGIFNLTKVGDTFLDVRNIGTGIVWVNGHNLGRAWNVGPQESLYLPAPWLHAGENDIMVFDTAPDGPIELEGVTEPIWKGASSRK